MRLRRPQVLLAEPVPGHGQLVTPRGYYYYPPGLALTRCRLRSDCDVLTVVTSAVSARGQVHLQGGSTAAEKRTEGTLLLLVMGDRVI